MAIRARSKTRLSLLDRIAAHCGIEDAYRDAQKKLQRTTPETKRLLLAAMGVRADDDAEIAATLEELERAGWQSALRPVYVTDVGAGPITIELNVACEEHEVKWMLGLEDGGEKRGCAAIASLPLIGQREIDGKRIERRRLTLGDGIPWGYHCLSVGLSTRWSTSGVSGETLLIVTPGRCWAPACMTEGKRLWGVSAQLYTVRSDAN